MERLEFQQGLMDLVNRHSIENGSNTPDFILADYLRTSLLPVRGGSSHRGVDFLMTYFRRYKLSDYTADGCRERMLSLEDRIADCEWVSDLEPLLEEWACFRELLARHEGINIDPAEPGGDKTVVFVREDPNA
jgi:hypothetical protein